MEKHPPDYLLVHPLPTAPNFVGRETELQELRRLWQSGFRGVLAVVGLGGAGKTALAARFLEELGSSTAGEQGTRPHGLFAWSFYQEPDAGLFLQQACSYFAGKRPGTQPAKGAGLLHLLREALAEGGPYWLILDGLERVQHQQGTSTQRYGQIEDPLLKNLLTRIAEGMGQTTALVTSRFPLTDLEPFLGRGYRHLDVSGLDHHAALALLRSRGVKGDDTVLGGLIESYGAHALTLDHLGGLIGQFLDGNPYRAPEVAELANPGQDRQALRLARLLKTYEEHLPAAELALLCRLCLLRRSVTEAQAFQFFLCSPAIYAHTVREIGDFVQRFPGLDRHLNDDLAADLAEAIRETLKEALCTEPIAGPEETFRAEISTIMEKVLEVQETAMEIDFGDLARLYSDPDLDTPTDLLPLSGRDRAALRGLYARYASLSEHPLVPFQESAPALEQAFHNLGFGKKTPAEAHAELNPSDVLRGLKQSKKGLRYLAAKHFALRRLRELCRIHQRKWSLAGPLVSLDASGMRQVLSALVARHLVVREADDFFSIHPAVRDHFHRLASALDQEAWHDILREHLVSLVQRPGRGYPVAPAALDLAEEAIYHALEANRADEALWLYNHVLGGLRHLGWKLGEMARGLRILRSFNPCPEPWDLAWYLRALGEFDPALACNELAFFRADILLLQGRLPQVAALGDSRRSSVAAFLMGKISNPLPDHLGGAISREQLLLYLGRLDGVRRGILLNRLYRDIGWEGDRARCQLILAEAARRQRDDVRCREYLEDASLWILHSGSVEHLCLLHLVRARLARTGNDANGAQSAVAEGLHMARQCGLELFHIELLCEQAEILMGSGDALAAEQMARDALCRASAADCQFVWGAAQAGHLLGQTLVIQKRVKEARKILRKTLDLRRRIGDPGAEATQRLLSPLR
jgi:hypothetical protein